MLVTLEGYDQDADLLGKFKKLKKIKKVAKKVKKSKLAKVAGPIIKKAAPYALSLASTAAGVPIPPQVFSKAIKMGSAAVKGKKAVKNAITTMALEKIGVNPADLKTESGISAAIKNLTPAEQTSFADIRTSVENQAISKATQKLLNETAAPALKKQKAAKVAKANKWTPEQIAAFNVAQSASPKGVEDLDATLKKINSMAAKRPESAMDRIKRQDRERQDKIKESSGDAYYKQGLLHGDDATLKLFATKIFSQNTYSDVNLLTVDHVTDIIKAYVYTAAKISEDKNKSYYYTGTTEAERQKFFGNIYIRAVYLYMKGISTEAEAEAQTQGYDYALRDRIWVVTALIKKFAEGDNTNTFMAYWKPFDYKEKVKALTMVPPASGVGKNKMMFIAAGVAGLVLLPKLLKGGR